MKKYIPLVIVGIVFIAITWNIQEGNTNKDKKDNKDNKDKNDKKDKKDNNQDNQGGDINQQSPQDNVSYTYTILSDDDWDINQRSIQGILSDTTQERCVIVYPSGMDPKTLFSFMDVESPSEEPRIRLVILYNTKLKVLKFLLPMLNLNESSAWKQAMFIYAKNSDSITKKVGNITPL